ncbi:hypothetical protein EDD15DRAFT_2124799, partial [Pisolithus albus]
RARGESSTAILFAEKDLFDDVKEERRMRQQNRKKRTGDALGLVPPDLPKRLALGLDNATAKDNSHNNYENGLGDLPVSETELRGLMVSRLPGRVNEGSATKRRKKDLEPAMDHLINANSRGVTCRRLIVETFFGSNLDKDINHTACEPSHPQGCVRCVLTTPLVCCDLHNPTAFSFVDILPPVTIKNAARSHLSKYTMDERELALCDALEDWREAKAVAKLGSVRVMDFGAGFILPSPMIDRIIDSAHHLKLRMIDDLRKETHWSGVGLYGTEVLSIVHRIIPQPSDMPALTRMPVSARPALQPRPQVQSPPIVASAFTSEVRKNRCSACGLSGHNRRSRACLQHPDRLGKENE